MYLGGGGTNTVQATRPVPAAAAPAAPAPYAGGGGGGGGTSVGPVTSRSLVTTPAPNPVSAPSAMPTIPPDAYKSDASYIAQVAALNAARQNYDTDNLNKVGQYNTQYAAALHNLGWSPAVAGAKDDPSTPNIDESKGAWNLTDTNTASGRGMTNQQNDFAARGLLQSSLYANAMNNLMRSLNDQNTSLSNAKTAYLGGLTSDQAQYDAQNTYQVEQAKQDAMQRVLSGLLAGSTGATTPATKP